MRFAKGFVAVLLMGGALAAQAADKVFDPKRDPAQDLRAAETQAQAEHKNILMDVGGNWCPWCMLLDRTLAEDAELRELLQAHYVVLRVNWSRDNENVAFLRNYPKPAGYPAWYVLSAEGKLLKSEADTSGLEADHKLGSGYNKDALRRFLVENERRADGQRSTATR